MGVVQHRIVKHIGTISDQHCVSDQRLIAQIPFTDFFFGNGVTAFLDPRLDAQNGKIRVADIDMIDNDAITGGFCFADEIEF